MNSLKLGWGIIGLGRIARKFAHALKESETGVLKAGASRSSEAGSAFGSDFPSAKVHTGYEALLDDPGVQAVYIATPHPMHAEWAVKAAEAGKHILCEKPAGINEPETSAMIAAAREHRVFFAEAFMYRFHPQTRELVNLITSGVAGEVQLVDATFGFRSTPDRGRLWSNELGGGSILDIGCYPVSMARLIAGAAKGKLFENPRRTRAVGKLNGDTGVDEIAAATLDFGGLIAQVASAISTPLDHRVRIIGTEATITVATPWNPPSDDGAVIEIRRRSGEVTEVRAAAGVSAYACQADAVAKAIARGDVETPEMTWADTLGNMRVLDQWRTEIGLTYDAEKPENWSHTVTRRPLRVRESAPIRVPHGQVPFVNKTVSRLVMGCDNQMTQPSASVTFDAWFERGGNAFDTAFLYGSGRQERLLGRWIEHHGVRKDVVVIAKGGHTPFCTPDAVLRQFDISLDRLRTDHADIYLLHRDNLDVPVGDFVELLNELVRAGRIGAYGGSNWTTERMAAARDYALAKGLQPPSAISNNFSLARMIEPVWGGCVSASDAATRAWLPSSGLALFAWSSQARGWFRDDVPEPGSEIAIEQARCWDDAGNRARRDRARQLASKKGCSAIHIAAAYVLHQPFPTFALIGPRTLDELISSLESLRVELTSDEMAWLNLETDPIPGVL